jgi:hypothetical protein
MKQIRDVIDLACRAAIVGMQLNVMVQDAVHGGFPAPMAAHYAIDELPRVAYEHAVIVNGVWPVGQTHFVRVQPIDAAAVAMRGVLDRLDVAELLEGVRHETQCFQQLELPVELLAVETC